MTQPTPLKNSPRQQADQRSDDRSTQQISEGALTPEHIQPVIDAQVSTASDQWSWERRTSSGVQSLHFTLDLILTDRLRSMVEAIACQTKASPQKAIGQIGQKSPRPDSAQITTSVTLVIA